MSVFSLMYVLRLTYVIWDINCPNQSLKNILSVYVIDINLEFFAILPFNEINLVTLSSLSKNVMKRMFRLLVNAI
jgi:hypothetical protein